MTKLVVQIALLTCLVALQCTEVFVCATSLRVFSYFGSMPVKDADDNINNQMLVKVDDANNTTELSEEEQQCWNLIKERSGKFRQQNF